MENRKFVVTKTHNFDPEVEASEFDSYDKANAYLHWYWEDYVNDELGNHSDINEELTYYEDGYAIVRWNHSEDCTEFHLIEISKPREEFEEVEWERYL